MHGTLFLIPSPLGDAPLNDVLPHKVNNTVNTLRHFIVEDLRTARRYLSSLKIQTPIDELHFGLLNEHTLANDIHSLLLPLEQGHNVGLLSDAGMPCIADPGELVVAEAHKRGYRIVPLVGPSSILLALVASGLNGENFAFVGYLSTKTPELVKQIKRLEQRSRTEQQCQLFIETPYRSTRLLETLLTSCLPTTLICVAANITCENEFIRTKTVSEWKKKLPELTKTPCIFILQAS